MVQQPPKVPLLSPCQLLLFFYNARDTTGIAHLDTAPLNVTMARLSLWHLSTALSKVPADVTVDTCNSALGRQD